MDKVVASLGFSLMAFGCAAPGTETCRDDNDCSTSEKCRDGRCVTSAGEADQGGTPEGSETLRASDPVSSDATTAADSYADADSDTDTGTESRGGDDKGTAAETTTGSGADTASEAAAAQHVGTRRRGTLVDGDSMVTSDSETEALPTSTVADSTCSFLSLSSKKRVRALRKQCRND